ncbi:MAG: hypothetical protein ACETWO_04680 [Candidatus Hadarchaeaceae archaeon]
MWHPPVTEVKEIKLTAEGEKKVSEALVELASIKKKPGDASLRRLLMGHLSLEKSAY